MAVYFDRKIDSAPVGQQHCLQWHSTYALLAIAGFHVSTGSIISIFDEEGRSVDEFAMNKEGAIAALEWHPSKKALACSWESGDIAVYDLVHKNLKSVPNVHKNVVRVMLWTNNGTWLVTGDTAGVLVIWKVDSRGHVYQGPFRMHRLCQQLTHAINNNVTHVNLHQSPSTRGISAEGEENSSAAHQFQQNEDLQLNPSSHANKHEQQMFFIATKDTKNGNLSHINHAGEVVHLFTTDGPVKKLVFCDERACLITMTMKMILTLHKVYSNGSVKEILKVKLSGKQHYPDLIPIGNDLLAACTGESVIRVINLFNYDNYILSVSSAETPYAPVEMVTCVAYCAGKDVLACGTASGLVCMWKRVSPGNDEIQESERCWKMQPSLIFHKPVTSITWGSLHHLLAVNAHGDIYILTEQVMSAHCSNGTAIIQTAPMQLNVEVFSCEFRKQLNTEIQVKAIYTTKDYFAIWDHQKVIVYWIDTETLSITKVGDFQSKASTVCLYGQNIYTLEAGQVQVRNFQGVVKQNIAFVEIEGDIISMDLCSHFLVTATTNHHVKVFDLSRRDARLFTFPKNLADFIQDNGHILSVKCNSDASRISFLLSMGNDSLDARLYVWGTDHDSVHYFNFATGLSQQDEEHCATDRSSTRSGGDGPVSWGKHEVCSSVVGRFPCSHFWDTEDPRLLAVEAKLMHDSHKSPGNLNSHSAPLKTSRDETVGPEEVIIVSLFVTPENGILLKDSIPVDGSCGKLLAVDTPFFYLTKKDIKQDSLVISSEFKSTQEVQKKQPAAVTDSEVTAFEDQSPSLLPVVPSVTNLVKTLATEEVVAEKSVVNVSTTSMPSVIVRLVHRDFTDLENMNKVTKDAMVNFSYYVATGDLDEAFKAVRVIRSESVWETLARMCVKTRRLDVARVCLANMNNPRIAMALRQASSEPDLEARVAILAIHLQLPKDAERLFQSCRRYDLLNQYHQAAGIWPQAFNTAQTEDRIHLRNTHYNYAKYLEDGGVLSGAGRNFEMSGTHRVEVPRMLLAQHADLEDYISKANDVELYKWWGHFLRNAGNTDAAVRCYEQANDVYSLVEIFCSMGKVDKALDLCNESGDRAACYLLAKFLLASNRIDEALHYFCCARTYGPAIKICIEHGYEERLISLALLGNSEDTITIANYYREIPGQEDKVIMLYNKAGRNLQAVQLAFKTRNFSALRAASESVANLTDPQLILKCANFFAENSQFDLAVELYARCKRYEDAVRICMEQHVPMTENLVEKLTPSKNLAETEAKNRIRILEAIGEVCFDQGQHHLATKKFIEAGNKLKAMKVLMKSGDTKKIIYFASVSREKEIYIMAANYLQSTQSRDSEIVKSIITFYKKGSALDSLCNFFISCAQFEIDEFKNYDKALSALLEANDILLKMMAEKKPTNINIPKNKTDTVKIRIEVIGEFLKAKRLYEEGNSEEAIKIVVLLLSLPDINKSVRVGDLLAFCISHYTNLKQWKQAYYYLKFLQKSIPRSRISEYIGGDTIKAVLDATNGNVSAKEDESTAEDKETAYGDRVGAVTIIEDLAPVTEQ